jgi:hypothetical protein
MIDDAVQKLTSASAEERELARDRLLNAPLEAVPLVEAALGRPGLDAESRQFLTRAVVGLRQFAGPGGPAVRTQRNEEWNHRDALDAYDRAGRHDPKWDDTARNGISLFTQPQDSEPFAALDPLRHAVSDLN